MSETRLKPYFVCVRLWRDERVLQKTLIDLKRNLDKLATGSSGPIFNHPDGTEIALIVQSDLPASHIVSGLTNGNDRTQDQSCLGSRDEVLVLPISSEINWYAHGYNRIHKMLPKKHYPRDPNF